MGDVTGIEWTDHTFSTWWGCSHVSPGCVRCFAERDARRFGYGNTLWRRHGPRRMLSDRHWQQPLKWNRDAQRAGVPAKVFCGPMCDVFEDHPALPVARQRLWDLIEVTPWLRWQLLTKRPENVTAMVPWGTCWPPWVWLGVSAENQRWVDIRIPVLRRLPAAVLFVSAEPLLGPIDLRLSSSREVDWLIAGGESGPGARPLELAWLRSLLTQCAAPGARAVPFIKQLGTVRGRELGAGPKGGDIDAWPADLRIRDFPPEAQVAA
jgi:protein gp37